MRDQIKREGDMNAKNLSKVGIGLTLTALALCGVLAVSVSCAGNGGGSGGSGSGGSGTGGGGGGSGGSSTTVNCPSDPGTSAANFCQGKAQGALQGYAYIALGLQDTASSPVCAEDPKDLSKTRPITAPALGTCDETGKTCPTTGQTIWNAPDALCITGTIPKVQNSDYDSDWGLQIATNTSNPPADTSGNGQTLGQIASDASSFTTIALTTTGTVTPANQAIRVIIHLVSMECWRKPYCATMSASDKAIVLTSFNTQCWNGSVCSASVASCSTCAAGDKTCLNACCSQLQASDLPNIDKIGVQISSDTSKDYTIDNYCLKAITFAK
jgi:hypothetical protein